MEGEPKIEWSKAQEITFGIDLVGAAKQQLRFLEAVDNVGCLYDGPALEQAIYRYKNCWLPLLDMSMKSSIFEGALVVPLDCEWIWHCHRLNPVQYQRDCENIYGRVLGKWNSICSTTQGKSSKMTELAWNRLYETEPYNLDLVSIDIKSPAKVDELTTKPQKDIEYDLVEAVKRQSCFFRKVSKMIKYDDRFFEEAVARYKGFLHLIKIIEERKLESSCVPTDDIDLIWHTHLLYPGVYCRDMNAIIGRVVNHIDRVVDSKKMKSQFSRTKELWEENFGGMYYVNGAVPMSSDSVGVASLMDNVQDEYDNASSCTNKCYNGYICDPCIAV